MTEFTYSAAFDDDVIEAVGRFTGIVPPTLAGGWLSRGSGTNFPGFDLVEWSLVQRNPAMGMQAVRVLVRGRAESGPTPDGPWQALDGTSARTPAAAAGRPQDFLNSGGWIRLRIPRQALVLNGDPEWPITAVELSSQYLHEDRRGNLERRSQREAQALVFDLTEPRVLVYTPSGTGIRTSPVAIGGLVSDQDDSAGVQTAQLAIQDTETQRWFDFTNGSWGTSQRFTDLELDYTNPQAAEFRFDWNEPTSGSQRYEATVRVLDRGSNEAESQREFFVDRRAPLFERHSPTLAVGDTLPIEFSVTDESPIDRIIIAIVDVETGLHWDDSTQSWVTSRRWIRVPFVATPDGATVSYDFSPATGSTYYQATFSAFDAAGREGRTAGNLRLIPADVTAPTTRIDFPAAGGTAPLGAVNIRGIIRDDVAPESVSLRIRDRTNDRFWNGGTWQDASVLVSAQLGPIAPPSTATATVAWFYDWDSLAASGQGGSGSYRVVAFGRDTAGNEVELPDGHNFTV